MGTKGCECHGWGYKEIERTICMEIDGEDCEPALLKSREGVPL